VDPESALSPEKETDAEATPLDYVVVEHSPAGKDLSITMPATPVELEQEPGIVGDQLASLENQNDNSSSIIEQPSVGKSDDSKQRKASHHSKTESAATAVVADLGSKECERKADGSDHHSVEESTATTSIENGILGDAAQSETAVSQSKAEIVVEAAPSQVGANTSVHETAGSSLHTEGSHSADAAQAVIEVAN